MTTKVTARLLDDVEEIRKRVASAGGPADHEGHDRVVVLDHTWVDVEPGGLGLVSKQRIVKILDEKAAADLGVLRFDYDPAAMALEVRNLRVFRKNGDVEEVDVTASASSMDIPQPARGMFWGPRMYVYRLPRLQVGDALEIRTFQKGFAVAYLGAGDDEITPPMPGHFFEVYMFEENVPVKEKRYTIVLPKDKPVRAEVYNGEAAVTFDFDDESVRYEWVKKDIPAWKAEPREVADTDAKTKLVLATNKTWEEKSRWFYEANKDQFGWDDAIQKKVDEVTAGLESDEEKAEALLHWVAQEIRYIGFSLGKNEGFTIHPSTMTFHERGGVCKESGGMLVTMLRAAGLEAYPAMTEAGQLVEEVPADQFNHCITAWKQPSGEFKILDPTWAPYSREVYCSAEQQQNYLIGTPEGETLGMMPLLEPETSQLNFEGACALRSNGTLEAEVTISGCGRSDTNLRRALAFMPMPSRRAYFEKFIQDVAPGAELVEFAFTTLDDFSRPQEYALKFIVPDYHTADAGLLRFRLPLARLATSPEFCRHLSVGDPAERKHKAMLWYTQRISVKERIRFPRGYRLADGATPVDVDRETASFKLSISQDGPEVTAETDMAFKVKFLDPKQFPGFRDVTQAIRAEQNRTHIAARAS